jgi:hypothetical protein
MSRILKRPMFKMGGSTSAGITSGLSRQGYHEGGSGLSTQERLLRAVGPRRSNVYDFLTEWGLNMASSPPQGNIIQTAAAIARDPYKTFLKGKQDEDNLLRRVALEGEGIDIRAEQDQLAAEAEAQLKRELLKTRGEQQKELYEIQKSDIKKQLIENEALKSITEGTYNNITAATNAATWTFETSTNYKDRRIGGILTQKMLEDKKFAKNQKKKNPLGTVYYDPFGDRVLELAQNDDGDYVLSPVEAGSEIITTETKTVGEGTLTLENAKTEALKRGLILISPRPEGNKQKMYYVIQKQKLGPNAVTIRELEEIIKQDKFKERYKHLKNKKRIQ